VYVSHLLQFGHDSHRGLFLVVVSCSAVILAVQAQVHESLLARRSWLMKALSARRKHRSCVLIDH